MSSTHASLSSGTRTTVDDTVADDVATMGLPEAAPDQARHASVEAMDSMPHDLCQRPVSLQALPELTVIIRDCWQQRDLRRPTAAAVHAKLQALLLHHSVRAAK
jgi:hypothetical protein